MSVFQIKVSGSWVDFSSMVERRGYAYEANDLDGPDSGRGMDGQMDRELITEKLKVTFTCLPAPESRYAALKNALKQSKFIECKFKDLHSIVEKTVYCSSFKATLAEDYGNDPIWEGGSFSIIER